MRKVSFFLLFFVFLACHSSKTTLILSATNVEGLSKASTITMNGFKIGMVAGFTLKKNKVFVKTSIDTKVKIPIDSKWTVFSASVFGHKDIDLKLGKEAQFFKNGDTIVLVSEKGMLEEKIDAIEEIVLEAIEKTIAVMNNDSIK